MSEEGVPNPPTKKKSCKSYASKVFKESSVSAVAGIASTGSTPRKVFRALVFILFTTGFLYQCIKFLTYVLTYPTVVSVEIRKPDSYIAPAFTFCNYNKMKRSAFCAKFPERCETPSSELCLEHPLYCRNSDVDLVPKAEYYLNDYKYNNETVMVDLGHPIEDFLKNSNDMAEAVEGPFLRLRWQDNDAGFAVCYTLHGRVNSSLEPLKKKPSTFWRGTDFRFVFDPQEDEVFNPYSQPGILFDFHSPFDAVNPFKKGILLKPGRIYKMILNMEEEKLLEAPYKTDCVNYTKKWLKNKKSGPRSQDMCRQRCFQEGFVACFGCRFMKIDYPSEERFCTEDDIDPNNCKHGSIEEMRINAKQCLEECKEECLKLQFTYTMAERKILPRFENGTLTKESRYIIVYVEIEDQEIISLEYKPQYQQVEAFSYIGGFIGIWLGVSLVQVADFFESTFRILRYICRKGTKCCHRDRCEV